MNKKIKKPLIVIAIILVLILITIFSLTTFFTDFLWFSELKYLNVFLKELVTKCEIGIPIFIIFFILSFLFQLLIKKRFFNGLDDKSILSYSKKFQNLIALLFSFIVSLIISIAFATKLWFSFLQFTKSTDFDLKDPIYNNDISFYIFKLDFIKAIPSLIILVCIIFAILAVVYNAIIGFTTKGIKRTSSKVKEESSSNRSQTSTEKIIGNLYSAFSGKDMRDFKFSSGSNNETLKYGRQGSLGDLIKMMKLEAIVFLVLFCLCVAFLCFIKQYDLLYTKSEVLYGAGYTDTHVRVWAYRILAFLFVLAGVVVPVGIAKRKLKVALVAPCLIVLVFLLNLGVSAVVQGIIVSPDAINKEGPYLQNSIKFTQTAYDLDKVDTKDFAAKDNLTPEDIKDNEATIKNIRINDYQQAKKFYNQVQNIRRYYNFNDVDVDRYMIGGEYTQTFLSVREIDETKISNQWINKHMKYTHGYGATISRVDKVTSNGQPDILVKNIPPESSDENIRIDTPGVYFGELTDNYALVDTDEDEFDYPDGEKNVYTKYTGNSGIKLNPLTRVLFAIKEQSLKLLVSSNINSDSKIIINRNITERVSKIMPFLNYSDPYCVTVEGKLYWIIDAYTKSSKYPYSESYGEDGLNYIRNSVKVVIDAYNGDTTYYIVDDTDPIIQTFAKIYPTLFTKAGEMPSGIKAHIRYPHTMLKIQSEMYTKYHVNDVKVFYQDEDLWEVSSEVFGTEEQEISPSYYILKLPGEEKEEFVSTVPYSPKDKKNMTGLLVARSDGENYGKLVLYTLPKTRTIMGPLQIEAQINQDTTISKEFSLWQNAGSNYSRGNLFVLPIKDSLVYVEPIYLESNNSSLPEVKRVIVYYKDKISYKPTLAEALDDMFGENSGTFATGEDSSAGGGSDSSGSSGSGSSSGTDSGGSSLTKDDYIQMASDAYEDAMEAQKNGDWAEYGEKIAKVEEYLKLAGADAADEDDEASLE